MPYRRYYSADRKHWSNKYVPPRGPLAGRRYNSRENYQRAYDKITNRDIQREEKYNEFLKDGIEHKGVPNKRSLARFQELYRRAKAKGWDRCPPAEQVKNVERDAPFAFLLDYIGSRPISEFGWLCVGDTAEVNKPAKSKGGRKKRRR